MVSLLRISVAVFLAAAVAMTGLYLASAKGQTMAVGQMVICVCNQVDTVYVDGEGQPTGAPHICPDCAVGLLAAVAPLAFLLRPHGHVGASAVFRAQLGYAPVSSIATLAKGPPPRSDQKQYSDS